MRISLLAVTSTQVYVLTVAVQGHEAPFYFKLTTTTTFKNLTQRSPELTKIHLKKIMTERLTDGPTDRMTPC